MSSSRRSGTKLAETRYLAKVGLKFGTKADAEAPAHRHGDVRLAQVRFFPDFFGHSSREPAPPLLTPQRLPCEQVDELVKEAAVMIKCENESGKLDEVR